MLVPITVSMSLVRKVSSEHLWELAAKEDAASEYRAEWNQFGRLFLFSKRWHECCQFKWSVAGLHMLRELQVDNSGGRASRRRWCGSNSGNWWHCHVNEDNTWRQEGCTHERVVYFKVIEELFSAGRFIKDFGPVICATNALQIRKVLCGS